MSKRGKCLPYSHLHCQSYKFEHAGKNGTRGYQMHLTLML